MTKKLYIILLSIFCFNNVIGQDFVGFEYSSEIPVTINGSTLNNAWAGGLISPQFSLFDINQNGTSDLIAFDRSGDRLMIFLKENNIGNLTFIYTDSFNQYFPTLRNWALFRDYNCDGKPDIFTQTVGGIKVFKNTSEESNISFEETYSQLSTFVNFGGSNQFNQNLYVERVDIPIIEDFDGNGKLDVIAYGLQGTRAEYHKNTSEDCETLSFELRNLCYGYFQEGELDNSITLGVGCSFNVVNPGLIAPNLELNQRNNREERHVGTSLSAFDVNGDGKKDIFVGDIEYFGITALINGTASNGRDSITAQINNWPQNTNPINIPNFPATYFLDLNDDGITDVIAAPNDRNSSKNRNSIWYYENIGTTENPEFSYLTNSFLQDEMIDVGEDAKPVFFDYNNDGLPDLVIASRGEFIEEFSYTSSLWLFENTGTINHPEFTLIDSDWLNLSALELQNLTPTFGDLNGDGKPDLILSELFGQHRYYINTAPENAPAEFTLQSENLLDSQGNAVTGGLYSIPVLFDINNNGLLDLIIGRRNGMLTYYQNNGTAQNPNFVLISNSWGNVNVREPNNIAGTAAPFIFKNEENENELIVGSESGKIFHYQNISQSGEFTLVTDNWFNLKDGNRCFPYLIDIRNTGRLDLFLGLRGGGIKFLKNDNTASILGLTKTDSGLKIYPNPAKHAFNIELPKQYFGQQIMVELFNTTGKKLKQVENRNQQGNIIIATEGLNPGLYLVRVSSNQSFLGTGKVIVK